MIKFNRYNFIAILFSLISALIILCIQLNPQFIPNLDGLYYINKLNLIFSRDSLDNIFNPKDHPWSIYLIYLFINVFSFQTEIGIYIFFFILNSIISFALISTCFLVIKKNYYQAILIVGSSIAFYDKYAIMILRDHGFWLFFIGSIYCFIKLSQKKNLLNNKNAFKFILFIISCLFLGFLFRVESLMYIPLFVVLIICKQNQSQISKKIIYLCIGFIISLFLIMLIKELFVYLIQNLFPYNQFELNETTESRYIFFNLENINFLEKFSLIKLLEVFLRFIQNLYFITPIFVFTIYYDIKNKLSINNNLYLLLLFSIFIPYVHYCITDIFSSRYLMISIFISTILSCTHLKEFPFKRIIKYYLIISFSFSLADMMYDKKSKYQKLFDHLSIHHKSSDIYSNDIKVNHIYKNTCCYSNLRPNKNDLLILKGISAEDILLNDPLITEEIEIPQQLKKEFIDYYFYVVIR